MANASGKVLEKPQGKADNIGNRYFIIADLTAHVYQY